MRVDAGMRYRRLGRSELDVSVIGMGGWALGARKWGRVDDDESLRAIRQAVELGINFFDTADIYGLGHSEDVLGKALSGNIETIIATKVGLAWEPRGKFRHDLSPNYIREACDSSLRRLRRDRIDLYQIHWADPSVPFAETLAALSALVDAGKIRYAGICNLSRDEASEAGGYDWLVSYQGLYNLIEDEAEGRIIPLCRRLGLGFIAYEPLYKGMLTAKFTALPIFGLKDHRRRLSRFGDDFMYYKDLMDKFAAVSRRLGHAPAALALALLLEHADVVIPGAKTAAQVRENAGAASITADQLARAGEEIDRLFKTEDGAADN